MIRKKSISLNGYSASVVAETRGTALYEAQYKRALTRLYPDVEPFAKALNDLTIKRQSNPDSYQDEMSALIIRDDLGWRLFSRINEFAILASHIETTLGLPFNIEAPMGDSDLKAAFEHFLKEDREEGFWALVSKTFLELAQGGSEPVSPGESAGVGAN